MIDILHKLLPTIVFDLDYPHIWDSLIINKRKPHTYRVFRIYDNDKVPLRVCLHRFDRCLPEECFMHPHPWPCACMIVKGGYIHTIGYSPDLESDPIVIYKELLGPGSTYSITHKQTWHSVQPHKYKDNLTIMINGPNWEGHSNTRTTKGKDLGKMSQSELKEHLSMFKEALLNET